MIARSLTEDHARRLRMRANRLLPGDTSASAGDVLRAVCGVQAQDLPSALLSVRARSQGLTATGIEQARQEPGKVVRTWLMRGTLHLASTEDASWLVPLLGPIFLAGDRRRMAELGWDEAKTSRGLHLVGEALEERGTLTRPEIAHILEANGLPFEGQATIHLIFRLACEGRLCYGPDRGKEPTFARFEDWAGPLHPRPPQEALADLGRRYLEAYAPAGPQDLASWSGLPVSQTRQAWSLIEELLAPVEIAGQPSWVLKEQLPWLDGIDRQPGGLWQPGSIRLLPRYDTYLLGYAQRALAVPPSYEPRIHPGGGQIAASLLVNGRVVASWKTSVRRGRLAIDVTPFEPLPPSILPLLEAEAQDVGRFLGMEGEKCHVGAILR